MCAVLFVDVEEHYITTAVPTLPIIKKIYALKSHLIQSYHLKDDFKAEASSLPMSAWTSKTRSTKSRTSACWPTWRTLPSTRS